MAALAKVLAIHSAIRVIAYTHRRKFA